MWYNQHYTGREIMEETKTDTDVETAVMKPGTMKPGQFPPGWHRACAWMAEGNSVKVTFERIPNPPAEEEGAPE